jgi:hypothetical protein
MARHPCLYYICRTCRVVAEPTLELLISNPLNLRAFVAPTLDKWDLRPLISSRTLRGPGPRSPRVRVISVHLLSRGVDRTQGGSVFSKPEAQIARGLPLLSKEPGH